MQTPSVPVATPSASAFPSQISDNPQGVAKTLKSALPAIGRVVKITEDNDDNKLLGRPDQYDAATFMQDKRLKCSSANNLDGLSIDCDATIERWASQEDAQARADDIQ